ncbi:molybdate ABC transporter substrate-binding protein [Paucibacter sp. DJ1R-11]|nr:molybdate ABC transporter substrate-binding protein [Paucibacter sp. DJ1R-11]
MRASRHLAASVVLFALVGVAEAADLTVSAASSLSNAFRELAPAFEAQNPGTRLLFNFAASDTLLAQIAKGAPVDVFAAADQETMDRAEVQKLLLPGSRRNFVSNELVLVTPAEGGPSLSGLADLGKPGVKRVALGRPEGVPAGRYAKGALEAAQLWPVVEAKAIYAVNVRQALDYAARGEVDAAFVYATDALVQKDKVKVQFRVSTETAIRYPVAAVSGGRNEVEARKFIDYLLSPAGQTVLARHGFRKP